MLSTLFSPGFSLCASGFALAAALAACASSPPPASASAAAPAPESAPESASTHAPEPAPAPAAPAPGPPPTGGIVLVGDILAPKQFNPKPTVDALKPKLLDCYNQARATTPSLHGKLKLRIQVNEAGVAIAVDAEPGGTVNDPTLVSCIGTVVKGTTFPKPGGLATVVAPMVFHP